jgi:hypothetical protein
MVYGKIFRKPFSSIYKAIFRSTYKFFPLTSILQRPKRPKMLKTFYGKRFTSKQTEPESKKNKKVGSVKRSVKRFIFCLVQESWQKNKKVSKVRWKSRNLLAT